MDIEIIPVLSDNYTYLLHDGTAVAVVDPAEADAVCQVLASRGLRLTHILNTHHHLDHIGGNHALKERFGAVLVGPKADAHRIPDLDRGVEDGDRVAFGGTEALVIGTPGHTSGHIAFWFEQDRALFCGDALFSLGCGRLFEGTPDQMWASLARLRELPDDTWVYCGHEYTRSNARFAVALDPDNAVLNRRAMEIIEAREAGRPSIPSILGDEKRANPFLRCDEPAFQELFHMPGKTPPEVFAELRALKDRV